MEDEFTCDDGTCIPLVHRCDEYSHCTDLSDEDNCYILSLNKNNYRRELAPSQKSNLDKNIKDKVQIQVNIFVDKVTKIQEMEMSMRVKFSVNLSWLDQRLSFINLKNETGLNAILGQEIESIWFPSLTFNNALEDRKILSDEWSKLNINRQGSGHKNSVEEPDEAILFTGNENQIMFSRDYELDFSCLFNLDLYPFDTQICDMWIITSNSQGLNNQTGLKVGKLMMSPAENVSLAQFVVTDFKMLQYNSTDAVVHLTFKRSLLYHFVTTYIPTTCLIVICEATLFVEGSHHFETMTMVTLTAKLVLFTAYQTISGKTTEIACSNYTHSDHSNYGSLQLQHII